MNAHFAEINGKLGRDMTLSEASTVFLHLVGKVKCGHTYMNFFNQTQPTVETLVEGNRVPFYVRWLDGRSMSKAPDAGIELKCSSCGPFAALQEEPTQRLRP